jgi:hypothetical protein
MPIFRGRKLAFRIKPAAVSRSFEENTVGSSAQLHLTSRHPHGKTW